MSVLSKPHRVGDVTVTRVPELLLSNFTTDALIPDWRPGRNDPANRWMVPNSLDAAQVHVVISTHSWLVQRPGLTAIVDTGVGNDKLRSMAAFDRLRTPFLDHLAAVGVAPDHVDLVTLTHLHTDHVGWNTTLAEGRWQPTFPNARYVLPQSDLDRVDAMVAREGAGSAKAALFFDSIKPILEAGQVETLRMDGGDGPGGFH